MNETLRELTDSELQDVSGGGTWLQAGIAFFAGCVIAGPAGGLIAAAASLVFDQGPSSN